MLISLHYIFILLFFFFYQVAIGLLWCPESPKFLLSKGRHREAVEIFSGIFATNTRKPRSDYPVTKKKKKKKKKKKEEPNQKLGRFVHSFPNQKQLSPPLPLPPLTDQADILRV